jgi:hypothetical protein
MLSLTCTGTFEFDDGVDKAALLAHLAEQLRKLDARSIRISRDAVSFSGGVFRGVNNWNILIPFGHGELIVDNAKPEVSYRLSVRQLVITVTIILAFVFVNLWSVVRTDPAILFLLAFGWLWLIGGNLMVALPRFKRFLRDSIDTVPVAKRSAGQ